MPCKDPSHQHDWPEAGKLYINKCERFCGYCTGEEAEKSYTHPWDLREHVREVHVATDHNEVTVSSTSPAFENMQSKKRRHSEADVNESDAQADDNENGEGGRDGVEAESDPFVSSARPVKVEPASSRPGSSSTKRVRKQVKKPPPPWPLAQGVPSAPRMGYAQLPNARESKVQPGPETNEVRADDSDAAIHAMGQGHANLPPARTSTRGFWYMLAQQGLATNEVRADNNNSTTRMMGHGSSNIPPAYPGTRIPLSMLLQPTIAQQLPNAHQVFNAQQPFNAHHSTNVQRPAHTQQSANVQQSTNVQQQGHNTSLALANVQSIATAGQQHPVTNRQQQGISQPGHNPQLTGNVNQQSQPIASNQAHSNLMNSTRSTSINALRANAPLPFLLAVYQNEIEHLRMQYTSDIVNGYDSVRFGHNSDEPPVFSVPTFPVNGSLANSVRATTSHALAVDQLFVVDVIMVYQNEIEFLREDNSRSTAQRVISQLLARLSAPQVPGPQFPGPQFPGGQWPDYHMPAAQPPIGYQSHYFAAAQPLGAQLPVDFSQSIIQQPNFQQLPYHYQGPVPLQQLNAQQQFAFQPGQVQQRALVGQQLANLQQRPVQGQPMPGQIQRPVFQQSPGAQQQLNAQQPRAQQVPGQSQIRQASSTPQGQQQSGVQQPDAKQKSSRGQPEQPSMQTSVQQGPTQSATQQRPSEDTDSKQRSPLKDNQKPDDQKRPSQDGVADSKDHKSGS